MDQLLTIKQVASYLRVSSRTIRWLSLPRIRLGRSVRYSKQAVWTSDSRAQARQASPPAGLSHCSDCPSIAGI